MEKDALDLQGRLVEVLLQAIPGCQSIYRFGTWGSSEERADSDIDLAFFSQTPTDPVYRWELAQKLAAIARRDVDLVDLLRASTVFRLQVVATGQRLFAADLTEVEEFEDTVFSSYVRLNEERRGILDDLRQRGNIYGQ